MDNPLRIASDVLAFVLVLAVLMLVLDARVLVREHIKRIRKGW